MLDKETKDIDAGVELLQDRIKTAKNYFLLIYIFGSILLIIGIILMLIDTIVGIMGVSLGISFLVISSYLLIIVCTNETFLFIRKYVLKEKKEK